MHLRMHLRMRMRMYLHICTHAQHLLPHGRYYRWALRTFEMAMPRQLLLTKLNALLHAYCDMAVSFSEQRGTSTSSCSPVHPARLLPHAAADEPPAEDSRPPHRPPSPYSPHVHSHSPPAPPAGSCVVLRGEGPTPSLGASLVGLAWLDEVRASG